MFSDRPLRAFTARSAILLLACLAYGRTAVAQELSPTILQTIPRVVERLNSADINERISVLDELVKNTWDTHLPKTVFPYNLPASDYSIVVQSILAGNLDQLDDRRASETWGKLTHVVQVFKLKEVVKPLTSYLLKSNTVIQFAILKTLKSLTAVESVPQIMTLLESPRENIRREALNLLVELRAKEVIPTLLALLDKDEQQRVWVMTSLVNLNARETAPAIAKVLGDEDRTNRYWALDALVKLNAREHAQAIWKLTETNEQSPTQEYALAALIYFGESRAIPLAVKKATVADLSPRLEMLRFIAQVKATAIIPALVGVLESRTVLGGNPEDIGTDSNIRRDIMTNLGQLQAREAIPVLKDYARGKYSHLLQGSAVTTLGVLGAKESVDDLLFLLDNPVPDDENSTAEIGVALAKIGDRKTWRRLIDLAARPSCYLRSEIISKLNRHLDRELWERVQTQKVNGLHVTSVKTTVEAFARESGIKIVLDFQPGRDSSLRKSLDNDGYPWANTSVEVIKLSYGLDEIVDGLSDSRIPRTYTFIFEDKQIRILSVERAIEWWRKQILSKSNL